MGARIAAHFANAGVPAILLDVDSAAVKRRIESAVKSKAFYDPAALALVTPGSPTRAVVIGTFKSSRSFLFASGLR
jgi:3-hydroxyacyl-CoA dehydrogenase